MQKISDASSRLTNLSIFEFWSENREYLGLKFLQGLKGQDRKKNYMIEPWFQPHGPCFRATQSDPIPSLITIDRQECLSFLIIPGRPPWKKVT